MQTFKENCKVKLILDYEEVCFITQALWNYMNDKSYEFDKTDWSKYPEWVKDESEEERSDITRCEMKFHDITENDYKYQPGEAIWLEEGDNE